MRAASALPVLLAALLLPVARAPAARTSPLDAVRDAVAAKGEEIGLGTKPRTAEKRALGRALSILDGRKPALPGDLAAAGPVCRLLDGAFPLDPDLDPALGDAVDALRAESLVQRAALLAWMGITGSDRGERVLASGIQRADVSFAAADAAADRSERCGHLRRGVRAVLATRRRLHLDAPDPGPPPFEGVAPDFSLADQNAASPTSGQPISPRDYLGKISAFYFTHTT